jgi:hypothetical protein
MFRSAGNDTDSANPIPAAVRQTDGNGEGDQKKHHQDPRDPIDRPNIAHGCIPFELGRSKFLQRAARRSLTRIKPGCVALQ